MEQLVPYNQSVCKKVRYNWEILDGSDLWIESKHASVHIFEGIIRFRVELERKWVKFCETGEDWSFKEFICVFANDRSSTGNVPLLLRGLELEPLLCYQKIGAITSSFIKISKVILILNPTHAQVNDALRTNHQAISFSEYPKNRT